MWKKLNLPIPGELLDFENSRICLLRLVPHCSFGLPATILLQLDPPPDYSIHRYICSEPIGTDIGSVLRRSATAQPEAGQRQLSRASARRHRRYLAVRLDPALGSSIRTESTGRPHSDQQRLPHHRPHRRPHMRTKTGPMDQRSCSDWSHTHIDSIPTQPGLAKASAPETAQTLDWACRTEFQDRNCQSCRQRSSKPDWFPRTYCTSRRKARRPYPRPKRDLCSKRCERYRASLGAGTSAYHCENKFRALGSANRHYSRSHRS